MVRALGLASTLQAVDVAVSRHPNDWWKTMDFWSPVMQAALSLIGLKAARAGKRIMELMADVAIGVLATSDVVRHYVDDYKNYHGEDRKRRLESDLQAVIVALARAVIAAANHAREKAAGGKAQPSTGAGLPATRQLAKCRFTQGHRTTLQPPRRRLPTRSTKRRRRPGPRLRRPSILRVKASLNIRNCRVPIWRRRGPQRIELKTMCGLPPPTPRPAARRSTSTRRTLRAPSGSGLRYARRARACASRPSRAHYAAKRGPRCHWPTGRGRGACTEPRARGSWAWAFQADVARDTAAAGRARSRSEDLVRRRERGLGGGPVYVPADP